MTYDQAEKHFGGSVRTFAAALGLPFTTVSSWKSRGGIPHGRQCEIELRTDGKLRAAKKANGK